MEKQKTKKLTAIIMCVVIGGLVIYDAIIAAGGGTTISQLTWQVCSKTPLMPFLTGIVCGHLFWQK